MRTTSTIFSSCLGTILFSLSSCISSQNGQLISKLLLKHNSSDKTLSEKPFENLSNDSSRLYAEQALSSFTILECHSALPITLYEGSENRLEFESLDKELFEAFRYREQNGRLILEMQGLNNIDSRQIRIRLYTSQALEEIHTSGAVTLKAAKLHLPQSLELHASGASHIELQELRKPMQLSLHLSGASKILVTGAIDKLHAKASGASSIQTHELESQHAHLQLSGASHCHLGATQTLSYQLSGASHLVYTGNPQIRNASVSGASSAKSSH